MHAARDSAGRRVPVLDLVYTACYLGSGRRSDVMTMTLALSTLALSSATALPPTSDISIADAGRLWDVAISRRPYITETMGELLVQLDPALTAAGKLLQITADLPCAGASWNWTLATKPGIDQYTLPFSLSPLPKLLNNDMNITVAGAGAVSGTMRRRFQRAWKPNSTNTAQVDHTTRGLLVDGEPWALMGWYIYEAKNWEGPRGGSCDSNSPAFPKKGDPGYANRTAECIRWGVGNMTAGVAAMGDRGITAVMPYNLDPYEHDGIGGLPVEELEQLILNYFDVAHAHGVKILHHMAGQGLDRNGYTSEGHSSKHALFVAWVVCRGRS
eukprot:COSAG02_NODE_9455_length_2211_cov_1.354167_4_plen_328_part_00